MRRGWEPAVTLAALLLASSGCADGEVAAAAPPSPAATSTSTSHRAGSGDLVVTDVLDGDTFDVALGGGIADRVRIIGMNAPEEGECFDAEATAALGRLLRGGPPALVLDVSERDGYGRLLRYVDVGTVDVGEALVRGGFAVVRVSEPDTARAPALRAAQDAARAVGAGLWADDACGAATLSPLQLVELRLDADGPDAENLNDEWVEVSNAGGGDADLGGWVIRDESSSHRYAFPAGFTLAPGTRVRIHSGCGYDTGSDLFWCETGSAVWNNDGDTALLLDPNGNIVDSLSG